MLQLVPALPDFIKNPLTNKKEDFKVTLEARVKMRIHSDAYTIAR